MTEERFRIEPASEKEAGFIVSNKLKAKILRFRSLKELEVYQPTRPAVQVRRVLPLLLEVVEATCSDKQARYELQFMAKWYYYKILK